MTRLPLWALLPILMVLAACSGQTPTPAATPTSVAATAEPSSITPSSTNVIPTPPPLSTPESTTATATPTPASSTDTATSIPTLEPTTDALTPAARPANTLAITVAPIPEDIPEYSRSQYKHWIDEDGDCQRQCGWAGAPVRKTPAGGAGGEGEDDRQTERQVSGCLGRAPRGPTRAGLAFASAFASARDPSLRDLRVHTDGRARQALSASSHLLSRLLHRASVRQSSEAVAMPFRLPIRGIEEFVGALGKD